MGEHGSLQERLWTRKRERKGMALVLWNCCTLGPCPWTPHTLRLPTKRHSISTVDSGEEPEQSGAVRSVAPTDAASALTDEGFSLLDVRPVWEWEKARVQDCLHVPLFVADTDTDPVTLLKKWVHFGYIGLWTGQSLTTINPTFLDQVQTLVPDYKTKLLVACGEGLRSRMAIKKLQEVGYQNLGWLAGGFSRASDDNFPKVEGSIKLQYATIGGVSYYLLQLLLLLKVIGGEERS